MRRITDIAFENMTRRLAPEIEGRQSSSPPTDRVVAVMQLLGAEPRRAFTLAEIGRALGISRATGHAILTALAAHDWVVRDPETGGYAWGPAIAALARPAGTTARLFRTRLIELADAIGMQVLLVRRDGTALLVVDVVGDSLTGAPIRPGFTVPLVAPFGREFVAWAGESAQQAWIDRLDAASSAFRSRMGRVLADVRRRGYAVERLSPEWLRVHTALQALGGDGNVDVVTARLAATIADVTVVDFLDTELAQGDDHQIATVMVPVFDADGVVTMSVNAIPFGPLSGPDIKRLGGQLRDAAHDIEGLIARYGDA